MAGPSKEAETKKKVEEYLLRAVPKPPGEAPINYSAISRETGIDRRTVKKHCEEEVQKAQRKQKLEQKSAREREEDAYREQLRAKQEQIDKLKEENERLLERLHLVEGNARRLGIDPDDLYEPLRPPDRGTP